MLRVVYILLITQLCCALAMAEEYQVKLRQIPDLKAVPATVDSIHKSWARARVAGTIAELVVTEGDDVKKGQIIANIIDKKQNLQFEAMNAELAGLEQQYSLALIEYNRVKGLQESGASSKRNLDEVTTKVKVLENEVAALKSKIDIANQNIKDTEILSPMDGKILKLLVTSGSVVMPGDQIAELAVGGFILRLSIPERHSQFLSLGQEIKINNQEYSFLGQIDKIYPELQNGRVIVDVKIAHLENALVGKHMTAYIQTSSRLGFIIPSEYLTQRYGLNYVKLKDEGEIVVQTGLFIGQEVEILSGLNDGDILVRP